MALALTTWLTAHILDKVPSTTTIMRPTYRPLQFLLEAFAARANASDNVTWGLALYHRTLGNCRERKIARFQPTAFHLPARRQELCPRMRPRVASVNGYPHLVFR